MELKFRCPECDRKLEVDASLSGTHVPCPNCQSEVTIPELKIGPGVTIGGCRIERPVGKGAMGEVFLATQLSMARSVALKILPSALTSNREFVGRFLHEVRMAAKLEHANIVSAFDAGEDNGVYYFAMAYVDGTGLDVRLKKQGALPEKEALGIVLNVAQALSYAWSRFHLLHRDVKPANILVDTDGEPMLTDMGIAKTVGDDRGSSLTATGVAVGTPHYMSPEQARGQSDLDFRADMYSLGATLYHLVVGEVPFPGTSSMEVVAKHLHDPLPPARKRNPTVSQACSDLIETMMAKDRAHRYQTWDACIRDMQAVHRGRASSAAMARAARIASEQLARQHRGTPAVPRRRLPVLLIAASAVLLLAVVVLSVLLLKDRSTRVVHVTESAALPSSPRSPSPPGPDAVPQSVEPDADAVSAGDKATPEAEETSDAGADAEAEVDTEADTGPESPAPAEGEVTLPGPDPDPPGLTEVPQVTPPAAETHAEPPVLDVTHEPAAEDTAADTGKSDAGQPDVDLLQSGLELVADDLLQRRYTTALTAWQTTKTIYTEKEQNGASAAVQELDQLVQKVCRLPQQILDSFRADTGRTLDVQLRDGEQRFLIKGVDENTVRAMVVLEHGAMGRTFTVDDLHMKEKIHRVGTSETAAGALMWGLLAYESGRSDVAVKFFRKFDTQLGAALARRIEKIAAEEHELAAERELDAMLRVIAKTISSEDAKLVDAIRDKCDSPKRMDKARELLQRFSDKYADTEAGKRWIPVVEAALTFPVPGQDWVIPVDEIECCWIEPLKMWVGRYEITNAQYRAFDPEHSSGDVYGYTLDRDEQPVVLVTFGDAVRYVRWLTEREQAAGRLPENWVYRLPGGAEWESFATCGDTRRFPWGPAWPPPETWNYNGSEAPGPRKDQIPDFRDPFPVSCPVKDSGRNDWGLYGVGGNVGEWTSGRDADPPQLHGGSWAGSATGGRPVERYTISRFSAPANADYQTSHDGFRLVLAPAAQNGDK
jgi:serine/threonine-protein kinase